MANSKTPIKAGKIFSKICEFFYWIGAGFTLTYGIVCFAAPASETARWLMHDLTFNFGCYGFNVHFLGMDNLTAGATYIICALLLALMALVFRNASKSLEIVETETPFQPKVQRMIRNMGFFMVARFFIANIGNFIVMKLADLGGFGVSVDAGAEMLVLGILVLCLSQMFARGIELETEVEGLI